MLGHKLDYCRRATPKSWYCFSDDVDYFVMSCGKFMYLFTLCDRYFIIGYAGCVQASRNGLSSTDAMTIREKWGYNELVEVTRNPFLVFLSYFWGPMPVMICECGVSNDNQVASTPTERALCRGGNYHRAGEVHRCRRGLGRFRRVDVPSGGTSSCVRAAELIKP